MPGGGGGLNIGASRFVASFKNKSAHESAGVLRFRLLFLWPFCFASRPEIEISTFGDDTSSPQVIAPATLVPFFFTEKNKIKKLTGQALLVFCRPLRVEILGHPGRVKRDTPSVALKIN